MRILVLCSDTGVRIGDGKGASLHLRAIAHAFSPSGTGRGGRRRAV